MARLKGFKELTPCEKALKTFLETAKIKNLKIESVSLDLALNRVLALSITAQEDLPRFDRSAVDGYAVKAEDTVGASQFKPKIMTITNKDEIGDKQTRQVWTGNSVPKGTDAVAMLENASKMGDKVEIWTSLTPSENISKKGEDIKKGEVAIEAGTRLKPQHLGLIASLGMTALDVFEKPKVAILATGNELVEIGNKLRKDQIFDVNKHVVSALCRELDAEAYDLGIAKDNMDEIIAKLTAGLERADAIITTGGTSVGASDLVPEAVNKIGKPGVIVHGIAMRPAMPTALAVANGKPIMILPGNPVAAMIAFEVFARPLICRMLGLKHEEVRLTVKAKMTRKVATTLGRRTYVRVHVLERSRELLVEPVSARGSSIISTMTRSNGYVVVPENREGLAEGETVTVNLFDNIEVVNGNV